MLALPRGDCEGKIELAISAVAAGDLLAGICAGRIKDVAVEAWDQPLVLHGRVGAKLSDGRLVFSQCELKKALGMLPNPADTSQQGNSRAADKQVQQVMQWNGQRAARLVGLWDAERASVTDAPFQQLSEVVGERAGVQVRCCSAQLAAEEEDDEFKALLELDLLLSRLEHKACSLSRRPCTQRKGQDAAKSQQPCVLRECLERNMYQQNGQRVAVVDSRANGILGGANAQPLLIKRRDTTPLPGATAVLEPVMPASPQAKEAEISAALTSEAPAAEDMSPTLADSTALAAKSAAKTGRGAAGPGTGNKKVAGRRSNADNTDSAAKNGKTEPAPVQPLLRGLLTATQLGQNVTEHLLHVWACAGGLNSSKQPSKQQQESSADGAAEASQPQERGSQSSDSFWDPEGLSVGVAGMSEPKNAFPSFANVESCAQVRVGLSCLNMAC
jgi:hypothetical protein